MLWLLQSRLFFNASVSTRTRLLLIQNGGDANLKIWKKRKICLFLIYFRHVSDTSCGAFVVILTQNHQIIHLFNIIEIINKFKIFKYHRIGKFSINIDLRKQDFLSAEKMSECYGFVNKDISQGLFNKNCLLVTQQTVLYYWEIIYSTKILLNMSSLFTFVKKREQSLIFFWLKKSCFLKSMLLLYFAFDVIHTGYKKIIIKIIFGWCLNRY